MEDTQSLALGRVRWYDAANQEGIIIDVGGGRWVFAGQNSRGEPSAFSPGQLVRFQAGENGSVGWLEPVGAA